MQTRLEDKLPNLAAHQLPGPDTETKLAALEFADPRMRLMLLESSRVGWPFGFSNDLYLHDRETLTKHPCKEMIWILRENGTHLYPTRCTTSGEAAYYRRVIEYWSGDDKLNAATRNEDRAKFYLLTDKSLNPISWQAARDSLKVEPSSNPPQGRPLGHFE